VWRLRRLLPEAVIDQGDAAGLSPDVIVDLRASEDAAHEILAGRLDPGTTGLVPMLTHDLLPDWDDPWLDHEQQRFRQLRLHALESVGSGLVAQGRFGEAVEAGLHAVFADPLRETSHRLLIAAHLGEGNRQQALRQYRMCERVLRTELDVAPADETTELIAELL
jgi:DNA-binding SARP family transcriptional activator